MPDPNQPHYDRRAVCVIFFFVSCEGDTRSASVLVGIYAGTGQGTAATPDRLARLFQLALQWRACFEFWLVFLPPKTSKIPIRLFPPPRPPPAVGLEDWWGGVGRAVWQGATRRASIARLDSLCVRVYIYNTRQQHSTGFAGVALDTPKAIATTRHDRCDARGTLNKSGRCTSAHDGGRGHAGLPVRMDRGPDPHPARSGMPLPLPAAQREGRQQNQVAGAGCRAVAGRPPDRGVVIISVACRPRRRREHSEASRAGTSGRRAAASGCG